VTAVRQVEVAAARLPGWVERFVAGHGGAQLAVRPGPGLDAGFELQGADGSTAAFVAPFPPWTVARDVCDPVDAAHDLRRHVLEDRDVGVVIVRRGGYATALVGGGRVVASKVGRRYVQGRTAAGGWSQQRFARRRARQADELVQAAADSLVRVHSTAGGGVAWLLTGGDRDLVAQVLADPRLADLARLPRVRHLAIGDPGADLVRALPERLTDVPVRVRNSPFPSRQA